MAETENKSIVKEDTFTKEQLLSSRKYKNCTDVLSFYWTIKPNILSVKWMNSLKNFIKGVNHNGFRRRKFYNTEQSIARKLH